MIEGITVKIGGNDYVLPNLNLRGVQKVASYLKDFYVGNLSGEAQITAIIKIVTISLQRNYPDLTEDFIADNVEDYEIPALVDAVNQQFTKKKGANPENPSSPSIGEESTPNSLPSPDGAGNT